MIQRIRDAWARWTTPRSSTGRPTEDPDARTEWDTRHPRAAVKIETIAWLEDVATPGQIEDWVGDARHSKRLDGLGSLLYVCRHFGYATRDYSWGELEKLLRVVIKRMVMAERRCRELEAKDPLQSRGPNEGVPHHDRTAL